MVSVVGNDNSSLAVKRHTGSPIECSRVRVTELTKTADEFNVDFGLRLRVR